MIYMFLRSNSSRRIRGTRNISHRRFHLHSFSRQGRVGSMGPTAPGVPARLFHRARLSTLKLSFSREAVRIKGLLDNNDKRLSSQRELFVSRSSPGEVPHGNAGIKSTTGTNLTYLVITLTPSTDTQDLLNNDDDVSERQVEGFLCVKNNRSFATHTSPLIFNL